MYLCYGKPATMNYYGWENEALPLGNGKIGVKVFGGDNVEILSFNEKTLWSGGKDVENFDYGIKNPDGGKALGEVQKALDDGNMKKAAALMSKLEGDHVGFGSFQAFGSLYINFDCHDSVDKYVRDLDLDSASAMVTYKQNDITFTRHYFVSYPGNIFAGRIESDGGSFGFDAYFVSEQGAVVTSEGCSIFACGNVNANNGINSPAGKDKNSMKHAACFKFIANDGEISCAEDGHIVAQNCTSVVIIASLATDYQNEFPSYKRNTDPLKDAIETVAQSENLNFAELYRRHLADYRAIFRRVSFSLDEPDAKLPTDTMLKLFKKRSEYRRQLITTIFQYGRYLLIASSREGSLPANLQGIWNATNEPKWCSDYHFNINTQMNYWPALTANMSETFLPYIDFVDSLRKPGRLVAAKTMGIGSGKDLNEVSGWVCHTMINPLGMVAPGFEWRWGWSPANGAWAASQLMEYYDFSADIDMLGNKIYPIMQESAYVWSKLLKESKDGKLVVSPCFSPEHGPVTSGGTYEQSIVYHLFKCVIRAADELKNTQYAPFIDDELVSKISVQIEKLKPFEMGAKSQMKEWQNEDLFSKRKMGIQSHHRHLSHLLGVYPFGDVQYDDFVLRRAALNSLKERGMKAPAWAMAHRLLCYARLRNGSKCDDIIDKMLKYSFLDNLFSNHPPFQVDGNFGFSAGICEMLLQSHEGYIRLLPALPSTWPNGSINGLKARGNVDVNIVWKDGRLKKAEITPKKNGLIKLCYDGKIMIVHQDENEMEVNFSDEGISSFFAEGGRTYIVT